MGKGWGRKRKRRTEADKKMEVNLREQIDKEEGDSKKGLIDRAAKRLKPAL